MSVDLSRYSDEELSDLYLGHHDMALHCHEVGQFALERYHRGVLPLISAEASQRAQIAASLAGGQLTLYSESSDGRLGTDPVRA